MLHVRDIEATCRHIGGHQHLDPPVAERLKRAFALALALVAMDCRDRKPGPFQLARQLVGTMLGATEDERQFALVLGQTLDQQIGLGGLGDEMHLLRDLVGGLARRADGDALGVGQVRPGDLFHLLGHGGRKQHRLAFGRDQPRDPPQCVDEAQIQHLVGLVQHEELCCIKPQRAPVYQVEQPTRRRHQDIRAPLQPLDLRIDRGAADHEVDLHRAVLDQRHQRIADLPGKLARRREDQAAHGFRRGLARRFHQRGHQRQAERHGLAGTGLGQPHHVMSVQGMRDGVGLDRRRLGDADLAKLACQRLGQTHLVE